MKSKVIVSDQINCPQSVLMSICSPCEIVQSVSQLAEGVKKRNKMMERKNERKIEERISWRQTSRILYTFPSLTPYVDFSNSFVHTHTHSYTRTHSLSYMRYFMSPGNNYSHNNINCRRWPTLFFSILLLLLELLLLLLLLLYSLPPFANTYIDCATHFGIL